MKEKAYYEKVNVKNETLLRNLLQKMPPYCKQFFIGIEPTTSSRTRIAYAYDLNCFFEYLHENNPLLGKHQGESLKDFNRIEVKNQLK